MRIGSGYDVHRLVPGRELVLCGVRIPSPLGLLGHSDADVATHALCDALLGAVALGDIGVHFPDSDPRYKGVCSLVLLEQTMSLVRNEGYELVNLDLTLIAERPKLAPYRQAMRETLAQVIGCTPNQVGVKATTTEGLGFTGRGEGIACQAIVLLAEQTKQFVSKK